MSGIVGSRFNTRGSGLVGSLGTDGQIFTSSGAGNSAVFEAAAGGGKILQVVSTTKTDTWSEAGVASGAFSDIVTGLTVAITPAATSSKILIIVNGVLSAGSGSMKVGFGLFRDTTQIDLGDADSSRPRLSKGKTETGDPDYVAFFSTNHLDSPSSTSELVYGIKTCSASSLTKTLYLNRSVNDTDNAYTNGRSASTITAIEVGA